MDPDHGPGGQGGSQTKNLGTPVEQHSKACFVMNWDWNFFRMVQLCLRHTVDVRYGFGLPLGKFLDIPTWIPIFSLKSVLLFIFFSNITRGAIETRFILEDAPSNYLSNHVNLVAAHPAVSPEWDSN